MQFLVVQAAVFLLFPRYLHDEDRKKYFHILVRKGKFQAGTGKSLCEFQTTLEKKKNKGKIRFIAEHENVIQ